MEIWKNIKGNPHYQVSNYGNIKSLKRLVNTNYGKRTVNERILKQSNDKDGYCILCLRIEDIRKTYKIHRLVAEHFLIKISNEYDTVNHKDFNKSNNNVNNLEWVSNMANTRHYHKRENKKCVGVSYSKQKGKYTARVTHNNKRIYLGLFNTEEDAIKRYYDYIFNNNLKIQKYI
jgi:hypothetical protein